MAHIGIIVPPVSGHINPAAALGRELEKRGHRVSAFGIADVARKFEGEGIHFITIGESDHPAGSLPLSLKRLGELRGLAALNFTVRAIERTTAMICRDAPAALSTAGVDALIVDQTEPAGGTVAEYLGLPYINVCLALAINREAAIPPIFTAWGYQDTPWARLRNRLGYALFDRLTSPVTATLAGWRRGWKLPVHRHPDDAFSPLAQVSQQPERFDFPRTTLPGTFHYTGPLRNRSPREVDFPYERLDGRPLVYASLGTLQGSKLAIFECIAAAVAKLDVQLVLSHGGALGEDATVSLPGRPLVVSYAPQYELLARASLTITHAGLNTVLDSLSHGVPLVAIPITYEQPATAARIVHTGCGATIPLPRLDPGRLSETIVRVLQGPTYTQQARRIQHSIQAAGGVGRAADIAEQVFTTGLPGSKTVSNP